MTDIILSTQNGEPVASSRDVAKRFGKRHDHVIRDIEELIKGFPKMGTPLCSSRPNTPTRRTTRSTPCT